MSAVRPYARATAGCVSRVAQATGMLQSAATDYAGRIAQAGTRMNAPLPILTHPRKSRNRHHTLALSRGGGSLIVVDPTSNRISDAPRVKATI